MKLFTPVIYYEHADPAGGGGGAAAVATPPVPQSPNGGQGPGADANGDFWGMFPNVPEEHRELLEPHLREHVLPYVNRMEGELAPFKPILQSGYTPEQVQGLVRFSQEFDQNPLQSWLKMAAALQQPDPQTGQPIIHDDLDLEILAKIAMGQELEPEDPAGGMPQFPQGGQGQPGNVPPEFLQFMQGLQAQLQTTQSALDELQRGRQQDLTQRQRDAQNRLLTQQMGTMRETLKNAGYPEDLLTDELLNSALITSRGNAQAAIQLLQTQRTGILKGFTEQQTSGQPGELDLSGGTPKGPVRQTRTPKDGFERERAGASAFLRRQRQAAAQG